MRSPFQRWFCPAVRSHKGWMATLIVSVLLSSSLSAADDTTSREFTLPEKVSVLPLFMVPRGSRRPTQTEINVLMRHLKWTQQRYKELLGGPTFEIAKSKPDIVGAKYPLTHYRQLKKGEPAGHWAAELLDHYDFTRFNCPYIFFAVIVNSNDRWPVAGARPLNGGLNTGGGIIVASTFAFTRMPNFQSTLQHEIGHSFGLPHVNVYGYDMKSNHSVMSYNNEHRTNGFQPSKSPGILIAEDYRGLGLNDRAFPQFEFDPNKHRPSGSPLAARIVTLGPMTIPDHPDYAPEVTTPSGETFGSHVTNIVAGRQIDPSRGPGITYRPQTMWQSAPSQTGVVELTVKFPKPIQLTRVGIHSQHSGKSHAARAVRIEAKTESGWELVNKSQLESVDATVSFEATVSDQWRFFFQAGPSRQVVIRGLQFFNGDEELFPPRVPYRETAN